ncbi:MAG TPA: hypothetical protein V6D03_03470 [Candidatus Caenarcaniphilales bacterium]
MFSTGDQVLNQKTGAIGAVIGYGYKILNSGYTTTLKVLIAEAENFRKQRVIEDLYSEWVKSPKT